MEKRNYYLILVVGVVIILIAAMLWRANYIQNRSAIPANNTTSTPIITPTSTPSDVVNQLTLAGGEVNLTNPPEFALAVSPQPLPVRSYIPPCDHGFDYCLYYNGQDYQGTNFESAGIRINRRTDLKTERLCLDTPPQGFNAATKPKNTTSSDLYSSSLFSPLGNAGAGHYANGSLYRLFLRGSSSCYEFETRIGTTQFANYPTGSIREFTDRDRQNVEYAERSILNTLALNPSGTHIILPQ